MRSVFFTEYIKNFRIVGAVAPSSRHLAARMVASIDFARVKIIVEYGPGTGIFTDQIVERMKPGTKLIAIETNSAFYKILSDKYASIDTVEIIHDSAENINSILKQRGVSSLDCVISGLPFAALPSSVSHTILESTAKLLGNSGVFITFQYTLFKKELFKSYFADIKVTREFRNIPPAYILKCSQ
ncbi:MAG: ribosomal adenine dimethylase [Candidatus Saccharibacteria bacterium]|nr:ribosomal adenine dimethylase [Candidatus Saccharibacteria bacterium]